ncbi:MAG: helix-turn-helix domain-containing protein [Caulobacteraceae bacterium]
MDLAAFRRSKGLSQQQAAAALGLRSKGYFSRIETGVAVCPLKLALKIEKWSDGAVRAADLCPDDADLLTAHAPTGATA